MAKAGIPDRQTEIYEVSHLVSPSVPHSIERLKAFCADQYVHRSIGDMGVPIHYADVRALLGEVERLEKLLNTPETQDFLKGVSLEIPHQRQRWGSAHDAGKTPEDWIFLVGHLATKAGMALRYGDQEKAQHHVVTAAAALGNWHAALIGADTSMRPGIDPVEHERPKCLCPETTRRKVIEKSGTCGMGGCPYGGDF